jgi:hypothetical protein
MDSVIKGMFWRPNKKEILEWIERKEREFSQKENRKYQMSKELWIQKYVYTNLHEICFSEFPIIAMDWLEILVENTRRYQDAGPRNWTRELVIKLNYVSNNTSHVVDFWLDSILGGHITDFAIDCTISYNVAERDFFNVP